MPADISAILAGSQQQQLQNPVDMAVKAMSLKNLAVQGQNLQSESQLNGLRLKSANQEFGDNQAVRDAFQKNVIAKPDGTQTLNRQGVLSDLYQSNPQAAIRVNSQFQQSDLDKLSQQHQAAKEILFSIHDQASHDAAIQQAHQLGLPPLENVLGSVYDPNLVKHARDASLTAEDQIKLRQQGIENQFKQQTMNFQQQDISLRRQQMQNDKVDKMASALKDDLDPDKSRAGNFGQVSARYQQGERLQTLVGAFKGGNLPSGQMEELSLGLANMMSNTTGAARSQVEAIVPHSIVGDANKVAQWVANEPTGANQQKFVDMMAHTIQREMDTASDQMTSIKSKRLSAHEALRKTNPQVYNGILQSYGMDPSKVVDGQYQTGSGGSSSKSGGVMDFNAWKASQGSGK